MDYAIYDDADIKAIADAVREKCGLPASKKLYTSDFAKYLQAWLDDDGTTTHTEDD